jgi:hypothetical protein
MSGDAACASSAKAWAVIDRKFLGFQQLHAHQGRHEEVIAHQRFASGPAGRAADAAHPAAVHAATQGISDA